MWFIDLHKKQDEFELSLSANVMLSNFSTEWSNNSLVGTNIHMRNHRHGDPLLGMPKL